MNDIYLKIYNNLVKLTTNKKLYINLGKQDTFSDRLSLFLLHFAFLQKNLKSTESRKTLQDLYDFIFRQIELSIREIGYGDQSINKRMKDYINLFHSIVSEIHFWDKIDLIEKEKLISKFLINFDNFNELAQYFVKFNDNLEKKTLNSFVKSVSKP